MAEMSRTEGVDVDKLVATVRALVMASTPFISALELGMNVDGEELHQTLREVCGISKEEWRESDQR